MKRLSAGEWLATAISAGAVAGAFLIGRIDPHTMARVPLCWSVRLLGRECAGCGLTRSFAAIGRGDWTAATALNFLGPVLFVWAIAVLLIRIGRRAAPRFRYWFEFDAAFAIAAGLAVIFRLVVFYRQVAGG